jgi:hypothetical protein
VLIHPWDAVLDDGEWRTWLADGHDFGQLVVNGLPGQPPAVIPTHFVVEDTPTGTRLLVHLARPNPVWANIAADPNVVVAVVDDYAYVPTTWRAKAGGPDEDGVPTSYYAAVQLRCVAEIVDDPTDKADLLSRQLAHFQPTGDHAEVAVGPRRTGGCCRASAGCAFRSPTWSRSSSTTTTTRLHIARGLRPDSPAELPAAISAPLTNNSDVSRGSVLGAPGRCAALGWQAFGEPSDSGSPLCQ